MVDERLLPGTLYEGTYDQSRGNSRIAIILSQDAYEKDHGLVIRVRYRSDGVARLHAEARSYSTYVYWSSE